MIERRSLAVLFCFLIAGCAGSRPARELSRETLGQVVEYEEQVREASRLLQAYYRRSLTDIGDDYRWMQHVTEITSRGTAAEDAVDLLLTDGYSARRLRDYLTIVGELTAADRARYAALRAKLEAAEAQAIKEAAIEESALKATRAKLELLQREPGLRDRAAQVAPLLEAAMKSMRQTKPASGGGS